MFMRSKGATVSKDFDMASSSRSAKENLGRKAKAATVDLYTCFYACFNWSKRVVNLSKD